MNIDGELVGINVAIRSGAQGIGFAIPIDDARRVIAELMSVRRLKQISHGLEIADYRLQIPDSQSGISNLQSEIVTGVVIERFEQGVEAADSGLKPGDVIIEAEGRSVANRLDLERAFLDARPGDSVELVVRRQGEQAKVQWTLRPAIARDDGDQVWQVLGLRLKPVASYEVQRFTAKYRGGLQVAGVRAGGPAERRGIREGDILVGLHVWETISLSNVQYVLSRPELSGFTPLKFYVLRGSQTLYGHLEIAK
jgi:serine protease Do